jgi:hypothetical protein
MTHLSSLSFTTVPHMTRDRGPISGQRLLVRLEERSWLAADPDFRPGLKVGKKSPDA